MRYFVTGGAGFIGSHVVDALVTRGDSVLILDDLSTGRLDNIEQVIGSDHVEFIEGSVLDRELVDDGMQACDACLHLASSVGVQLIVDQTLDSLLNIVRGSDVVISAAARRERKLLFTSTSEIYGKTDESGLTEGADRIVGSPFRSRWAYATAKAFGEALAHSYCAERGAEMVVARLFNAVGARQSGAYGMVLPRFVRQALTGADLTVYGNGIQTRCFTHVSDSVRAIILLMDSEQANGGVYNVGSAVEVAIVELARQVIERSGSDSTVRLVPYEEAYEPGFEELGRRVPDTSALRQVVGWEPIRTIEEAIDDVIAHERSAADVPQGLKLVG
jgi:UDP-glucose 4-epimerase